MSLGQVHLNSRVRSNLTSLQNTQSLLDRTNSRLNTGLKVQSAVDDPVAFFKSKGLSDRASSFEERKQDITQGIDALNTTQHALSTLVDLAKNIKSQFTAMRGASSLDQLKAYQDTLKDMKKQFTEIARDAQYNGKSLLSGSKNSITVTFSHGTTNAKLEIKAVNLTTSGEFGKQLASASADASKVSFNAKSNGLNNSSVIDKAEEALDAFVDKLRAQSATFGGNLTVLNVRSDFTKDYTSDLEVGSGDLVLADTQLEGTKMASLRTSQSLGLNSLGIATQQDANVLQLIRG